MLDNDLIRLNQKLNIVLQLRGKEIESERHLEDVKTAANAQKREMEAAEQQRRAAEQLAHQTSEETVKVSIAPQESKEKVNEPANK
jgi:multidrug resistance efflux pump